MKLSQNKSGIWIRAGTILVVVVLTAFELSSSLFPAYAADFAPDYVAFGDSITTGSSIATCRDDRRQSPWGCSESSPAATPYPDRVAVGIRKSFTDRLQDYRLPAFNYGLYRAGIWGYTVQEAAEAQRQGHNAVGGWKPQLQAISQARQLVTGSLGINDLHFGDIAKWAKLYIKPGGDHVTPEVQRILQERSGDFNTLMSSFQSAEDNGARVIVGLYYNPYDTDKKQCRDLKTLGNRLVNTLDAELTDRSRTYFFSVADFRPAFRGHGAGSGNPYVFGTQCKLTSALKDVMPKWLGGRGSKKSLQIGFDPHPNNDGTLVMANTILQEYNGAD